MARSIGHLISKLDHDNHQRGRPTRALAILAIVALLATGVAPGWALAAQADSEGEGQGTTPPRLGNPEIEPGGSETVLEALPGSSVGEEVEGDEVVPPVETEPAVETPAPEAVATEEESVETEVDAPAPTPAPTPAPASATPEYVPSPPAPTYETAPPPQAQPVENEAIVAPAGSAEPSHTSTDATQPKVSPPASPPIEEPSAPSPAPTEPAPTPTVVLAPDPGARGPGRIPAGRTSYTVHPGDCLWSIAAALLPAGADEAQVAAEVARLWHLNAGRIGTGDPNLILVGTVLRLG